MRIRLLLLVASLALVSLSTPGLLATTAIADDGDEYLDWSCKELYRERNGIYKDAGFCFGSKKAIKMFGNAGCEYDDQDDVPLSTNQRATVRQIVAAERENDC